MNVCALRAELTREREEEV